VITAKVITLAGDDHAKNGAPVRKERSASPKMIMRNAMARGND